MLNLATILETSARENPGKPCVILDPFRLSYAEVDGLARQVAKGLQAAGIRHGDKVALSCPNIPYFPIIYFGILKAGAVVVPINVLLKHRELAFQLKDSDARAFFCFEGTDQLAMGKEGWAAFQEVESCEKFWVITREPGASSPFEGALHFGEFLFEHDAEFDTVSTRADDTAVIMYTSGTTGRPKGAELSHSNLLMNAMVCAEMVQGRPDDITLVALPLFHSFGQTTQMNSPLVRGGTQVHFPRFSPEEMLRLLQDENITTMCGVPTMFLALAEYEEADKFDLNKIARNMRVAISGGASLSPGVLERFEEKYGFPIREGYGLSEASPVITLNRVGMPRKIGSVGVPIWGVDVRIVDGDLKEVPVGQTGEVIASGHGIMKGYYKRPEATDEILLDGWLRTGDVGRMDEDRSLFIVDRTTDMILRGGENVYPREVEDTLMMHPDISIAAVVGVPDEKYGEEIKAFIVPVPKVRLTAEDVIEWAKQEMARFKCPKYVEICDSLPMNAIGKVLKKDLRKGP